MLPFHSSHDSFARGRPRQSLRHQQAHRASTLDHRVFLPQKHQTGPVAMTGPVSRETEPKLLSMLFQVLFHGRYLVGVSRTKPPVLIDINEASVLKTNNHIWSVIPIHIHETQRDRDQSITITIKLWPNVDTGFRGIATWKIDHLDTPIEALAPFW
jgi:hypothetical protein